MQAYRKDLQVSDINRQFGKLTDRTEARALSLSKGPALLCP